MRKPAFLETVSQWCMAARVQSGERKMGPSNPAASFGPTPGSSGMVTGRSSQPRIRASSASKCGHSFLLLDHDAAFGQVPEGYSIRDASVNSPLDLDPQLFHDLRGIETDSLEFLGRTLPGILKRFFVLPDR